MCLLGSFQAITGSATDSAVWLISGVGRKYRAMGMILSVFLALFIEI